MLALVASSVPALSADISVRAVSGIMAGSTKADIAAMSTPHISICVTATRPMPQILPSMRCVGLTDDTTISSTRLFFSSMMLVITICP